MPVEYKDYYKTLGVGKKATAEEIKRAYRKLARQYHPDVNKKPEAERRFKEINEAHEVLADPEKRRRYDQVGPEWERFASGGQQPGGFQWVYTGQPGAAGFADGGAFSDFFRTVFGGAAAGHVEDLLGGRAARPRARGQPGQDFEHEIEIGLAEAYRGTDRTIELRGTGGGTRRLDVKIPLGVRDGQRVRLAGQGGSGSGGAASGDLYLRVRVRPHQFFQRDGDDLRADLPVALHEAMLGAEVTVPTLKGRVALRIPAETQNGRTIRLAGQGLPRPKERGGGFGDLYVTVKVVLPQKLSHEEREFARKLAAKRPRENVRSHLL